MASYKEKCSKFLKKRFVENKVDIYLVKFYDFKLNESKIEYLWHLKYFQFYWKFSKVITNLLSQPIHVKVKIYRSPNIYLDKLEISLMNKGNLFNLFISLK